MRSTLIILLLAVAAESHLEFDFSQVYDMEDFRGTPNYPIRFCESGCRVYLTYINEAPDFLGDKYLKDFQVIVDDDNNITFYDLNRMQLENGEKGFYEIPEGTSQFVVHNANVNGAVRPLCMWIVQSNATFLDTVEVYDAPDGAKITSAAKRIVLINIAPFTAYATIDGKYAVTIKPSPFDMLSNGECEHALKIDDTISQTFSQSFNSPIISFGFDQAISVTFDIDLTYPDERSIDASGYLASPGYIGCANKTFVFRSESYNFGITSFNETFLVDGTKVRHVSFYGDLNTDESAPILLYDMDTAAEPLIIYGTQNDNTSVWDYEMDTSSFSIHWDSLHWKNESFMIRYEIDGAAGPPNPPKTTVVTTVLPKTSTTKAAPVEKTTVEETTVDVQTTHVQTTVSTTVIHSSSTTMDYTTTSSSLTSFTIAVLSIVVTLIL